MGSFYRIPAEDWNNSSDNYGVNRYGDLFLRSIDLHLGKRLSYDELGKIYDYFTITYSGGRYKAIWKPTGELAVDIPYIRMSPVRYTPNKDGTYFGAPLRVDPHGYRLLPGLRSVFSLIRLSNFLIFIS